MEHVGYDQNNSCNCTFADLNHTKGTQVGKSTAVKVVPIGFMLFDEWSQIKSMHLLMEIFTFENRGEG